MGLSKNSFIQTAQANSGAHPIVVALYKGNVTQNWDNVSETRIYNSVIHFYLEKKQN